MATTRRVRLQFDCLEERLPLSSDVGEPPPSDPGSLSDPIDPTFDPFDSTNASYSATITQIGQESNGVVTQITVTGLPAGSENADSVTLQIGEQTYTVNIITANADGSYKLTVAQGIDASTISLNQQVTVILGSGSSGDGSGSGSSGSSGSGGSSGGGSGYIDPTLDPFG